MTLRSSRELDDGEVRVDPELQEVLTALPKSFPSIEPGEQYPFLHPQQPTRTVALGGEICFFCGQYLRVYENSILKGEEDEW